MRRTRVGSWAGGWLWVALAAGCGPTVTLDPEDGTADDDTTAGPTTATTSSTTAGPTTTPPPLDEGPLDEGPLDEGPLDEGPLDSDFVSPFDQGVPEDCSTIEQDCPPGYKCMPWANDGGNSWNDTLCVPIADDPSGPGEPCTVEGDGLSGIDDCEGGSICWDVDPKTNEGHCVAFCTGSEAEPTCAEPCDKCTIGGDGVIALCFTQCDPLAQDCDPGEACYPFYETFACIFDGSPDDAQIGSPCEYINACPPGMACMDQSLVPSPLCMGSVGCCAPYCPVDGADTCPGLLPGTSCMPLLPEGVPVEGCLTAEPGICVTP